MKVAYLILAHKNPIQFKRLINKLSGDIYVHIDKKCNIDEFKVEQSNIFFIKQRIDVKWGGYSMIEATLNLINEATRTVNYNYFILLSGDDYLIKNEEDFFKYLIAHEGNAYIELIDVEKEAINFAPRYKKYHMFEKKNIITKIIQKIIDLIIKNRRVYSNMKIMKGSQWWCLDRDSIEYLQQYIKNNPKVLKYFKHVHIPDEMFFQTILFNSPQRDKIINDNLRYIILEDFHPEILTRKDFKNLKKAENKFFARKFDINIDGKILDKIDKYLEEKNV